MSLRERPSYKKTSLLGKERINNVASWKNIQENVMIQKVLRKVCCILAWLEHTCFFGLTEYKQAPVTRETILLPESTIGWSLAV